MSKIVKVDGRRISVPDDATMEEIDALSGGTDSTGAAPMAMTAENNPATSWLTGAKSAGLKAAPSLGGLLGGIGGGMLGGPPGAVVGAMVGGAAGEGVRQGASGQRLDAADISGEGLYQGGAQALGGAAAKGMSWLARPIMRSALGIGGSINGMVKMGGKQVVDPVEEAFARKVTVGQKGFTNAEGFRREAGAKLEALINTAKLSGKTARMADVSKAARQFLRAKDGIPAEEKARIIRTKLIPYLQGKGKRVDPALLQDIKRYFADEAEAAYKAADVGNALEGQAYTKYAENMAQGAREGLESMVPGIGEANARYQKISVLEDAVRQRVQRPAASWEVSRPGTYPLLKGIATPERMSQVALKLNSPRWQEFIRQQPRLAAALLAEMTHTDEPDATR